MSCQVVSSNELLDLNVTSCNVTARSDVINNFIPTKGSFPNNEADFMGVFNRQIHVEGYIEADKDTSAAGETLGKITVSGLHDFLEAGSLGYNCWFYDEFLSMQHIGVTSEWSTSGMWVMPQSVNIRRTTNYSKSSSSVGYVLKYSMELIESSL